MNKFKFLLSDFKQLIREPMMFILFLAPILITIIIKILYVFLLPHIQSMLSFDIYTYKPYILSLVLLFSPMMLGVVMGFMMLDDKDAKIIELMSITPLGRSGYLINRLSFVLLPTIIYTFLNYYIMQIYIINLYALIYLSINLSFLSVTIGIVFASLATDKIKGLTYAKGLNIILIFAFGDLFKGIWMKNLSSAFPTYWVTSIIINQNSAVSYIILGIINIFWMLLFINIYNRNLSKNLK